MPKTWKEKMAEDNAWASRLPNFIGNVDAARHAREAKSWKDLAYRAFQKQLASKEKAKA